MLPIERRVLADRRSLPRLEVCMNRDRLVTASEIAIVLPVSVQLVSMWKRDGKLTPAGKRGRSPLYRYGDVSDLERDMAVAAALANNHRARRPIAA